MGQEKIGFVGLGVMGRPMAVRLLGGGLEVHLHSRSGVPAELTASGGQAHGSGAEVARRADVVFTMLPATADVETAVFGPAGIAEGLTPGKVVVDMSSISPVETVAFARRIEAVGCAWVDAPVSGGEVGAQQATLTIMAGASEEAFARVEPLLQRLGTNVTRVGPNGAGQTCKVANQIVVAITIEAVAEALVFASKAGVDPARVRQALLGGFASSRVLELHGRRMIDRSFAPGARIALHQKDLDLALASARQLGVALPGTALAQQLFEACRAHGGAAWDHAAMVRALELLADHPIAR